MSIIPCEAESKIKLGISSCLLGNAVRYDGKHQYHPELNRRLADDYELLPFCPEIAIGLGVPRPKIQLVERDHQILCLDEETHTIDYTQPLLNCYQQQKQWLCQISGYIFKTKSPSCGLSQVKTDYQGQLIANGQGIFANQVIKQLPGLPVIEEHQFDDPDLVALFLNAVEQYHCQIQLN